MIILKFCVFATEENRHNKWSSETIQKRGKTYKAVRVGRYNRFKS